MARETDQRHEFEQALDDFVSAFELVFDNDWDLTRSRICDEDSISAEGTFINPRVESEDNNWANRGSLLSSYRHLRKMMDEYDFGVNI